MMKKITFLLSLISFYLSPAQDTCVGALPITPGTYTVATVNGPEIPSPFCASGGTGATAGEWYSFTATSDGVASISTNLPQNSGRDTRVHIYVGACGAFTCVGGNDDVNESIDNYLSFVSWEIATGTTYYIAFDNRWESMGFDFQLSEFIPNCDFTLPYSEDFSNIANPLCWDNIDDDGDGISWFTFDYDLDNDGMPDGNPTLVSESWRNTPLTPDNWLISDAIDLTLAGGTITLTWKARGKELSFPDENYTVYVATANAIPDFLISPTSFNEIIGQNGGAGNTFADRSLDISSFAGQTVYVAFRHHDITDQFVLNIDDVAVQATLSNTQFTKGVTHYYQKNTETLVLQHTKTIDKVLLYTLLGQEIFPKTVQEGNKTMVSLQGLPKQVYLVKVASGNQATHFKLLKD